jgi:hypothetical protein
MNPRKVAQDLAAIMLAPEPPGVKVKVKVEVKSDLIQGKARAEGRR